MGFVSWTRFRRQAYQPPFACTIMSLCMTRCGQPRAASRAFIKKAASRAFALDRALSFLSAIMVIKLGAPGLFLSLLDRVLLHIVIYDVVINSYWVYKEGGTRAPV